MEAKEKVTVIYEDEYFIVVNKAAGLVVQNNLADESVLSIMSAKYPNETLYITNRIDQVVSGICILTKSKNSTAKINELIVNSQIQKRYLAVVKSGVAKKSDSFQCLIFHDKRLKKAFVNPSKGKPANLSYRLITFSDNYDLLEVEIKRGRFHQIRCILGNLGMPIKGDVKYGFRRANKGRFIHLHAKSLTFTHPYTGRIVSFSAPLPSESLWQFFDQSLLD